MFDSTERSEVPMGGIETKSVAEKKIKKLILHFDFTFYILHFDLHFTFYIFHFYRSLINIINNKN